MKSLPLCVDEKYLAKYQLIGCDDCMVMRASVMYEKKPREDKAHPYEGSTLKDTLVDPKETLSISIKGFSKSMKQWRQCGRFQGVD